LYTKILADINSERDEIISALNPLAKLLRLRQVNGSPELVDPTISPDDPDYLKKNAKLVRLLELLDDAVARDEKTVIFSNWVEPLRTLYKFISKKYKTCAFTGTMSTEDREKHKKVFMENPEYKVLLGTIGAAGTAHTFTSARNVIFFDDPWNPSDKEQAEDRLHRIGTTESINVFTLVSKDTIDEKVEQILYTKDGIAKYIVDGKLDLRRNPDLFDLLIGGN
jgi:SNF2 family DNA or RNA helicase